MYVKEENECMEENESKSLASLISSLYREGAIYLSSEFSQYNIGYGQIQFLVELYKHDDICYEELTRYVRFDKATTTRAITKLYESGYVVVQHEEKDKRKLRIRLTEKAKEQRERIMQSAQSWDIHMSSGLEDGEIAMLKRILSKIVDHI